MGAPERRPVEAAEPVPERRVRDAVVGGAGVLVLSTLWVQGRVCVALSTAQDTFLENR